MTSPNVVVQPDAIALTVPPSSASAVGGGPSPLMRCGRSAWPATKRGKFPHPKPLEISGADSILSPLTGAGFGAGVMDLSFENNDPRVYHQQRPEEAYENKSWCPGFPKPLIDWGSSKMGGRRSDFKKNTFKSRMFQLNVSTLLTAILLILALIALPFSVVKARSLVPLEPPQTAVDTQSFYGGGDGYGHTGLSGFYPGYPTTTPSRAKPDDSRRRKGNSPGGRP